MNKRAGEEIITPWLIVVWAIILIGIVAGILIFYSAQADARQKEAEILNFKIEDCLKENFDDFDLFQDCKINKEMIEDSGLYYIKIKINDEVSDYGVRNFETLCNLSEKNENFPKCYETEFYIQKDKLYKIKILTASNQLGAKT